MLRTHVTGIIVAIMAPASARSKFLNGLDSLPHA